MVRQNISPFRAGLGQDLAPSSILLRSKQRTANYEQINNFINNQPSDA
jgi:hypothetical protein